MWFLRRRILLDLAHPGSFQNLLPSARSLLPAGLPPQRLVNDPVRLAAGGRGVAWTASLFAQVPVSLVEPFLGVGILGQRLSQAQVSLPQPLQAAVGRGHKL